MKTFADFSGNQWKKLGQHFPAERQNGPRMLHEEQAWSFQFIPSSVILALEEKQFILLLPNPQVSSSNCWAIPKFHLLLLILGFDGLS